MIGTITKDHNIKQGIQNIRQYNSFEFVPKKGIRCFMAGKLGNGLLVNLESEKFPGKYNYKISYATRKTALDYMVPTDQVKEVKGGIHDFDDDDLSLDLAPMIGSIYRCSNEKCDKRFMKYGWWLRHELSDNCVSKVESSIVEHVSHIYQSRFGATAYDQKKLTQRERRHAMTSFTENLDTKHLLDHFPFMDSKLKIPFERGFIFHEFPKCKVTKEEQEKQVAFVKTLFESGEGLGIKKFTPESARLEMINAMENGTRLFPRKLWLQETQIQSLFGRFAAQKRYGVAKKDLARIDDDYIEDEVSEEVRKQKATIIQSISNSLDSESHEDIHKQEHPFMVILLFL